MQSGQDHIGQHIEPHPVERDRSLSISKQLFVPAEIASQRGRVLAPWAVGARTMKQKVTAQPIDTAPITARLNGSVERRYGRNLKSCQHQSDRTQSLPKGPLSDITAPNKPREGQRTANQLREKAVIVKSPLSLETMAQRSIGASIAGQLIPLRGPSGFWLRYVTNPGRS